MAHETRSGAARALGITPATLDRWVDRGAPKRRGKRGGRLYDVVAVRKWRRDRDAKRQPVLDLAHERAALARVQRELTELKVREARAELVKADDVERVQRAALAAVRAQLLAVPRRCVLAGLPRSHEPLVKRHITEALRELSALRTLADLEGAA